MSDLLSHALSVLAGEPCLSVGQPLINLCRPVLLEDATSDQQSASTWLCEGGLFFTLLKHGQDTLLFSHQNEMLYFASLSARLAPACPDGTAFLCQFAIDAPGEPRLLALDLLSPDGTDPILRGERLRAMGSHLPQPLCCVQWVGQAACLTPSFLSALPHASAGVLFLQSQPGRLGVAHRK